MKNIIFSMIKSVQENCVTFSCRLCADLSSFFWTNTFTKKLFYYGTLLLFGFGFTPNSYGQLVGEGGIKANFGVEADAYANFIGFSISDPLINVPPPPGPGNDFMNTDDWFEKKSGTPVFWPGSGKGVIDQSNLGLLSTDPAGTIPYDLGDIKQHILDNSNYSFTKRQTAAYPPLSVVNTNGVDYLWIDSVYGRDYNVVGIKGDAVDKSWFTSGADKNADNPSGWTLGSGSGGPQKDDIIDAMAHLRGIGPKPPTELDPRPFTTLWAFGAATLRSTSGDKHIDFEFFRTLAIYDPVTNKIINTGADGGRTAFTFYGGDDPLTPKVELAGEVNRPGTILVSIDYSGGGRVPGVEIRVWMKEADFLAFNNSAAGRPFNVIPGTFVKGTNSGDYGYGQITEKTANSTPDIFGRVNVEGSTLAAPWGTLEGEGADFSDQYLLLQHVEIGINLTAFGLDKKGDEGPCANILGSLLVKTRSSGGSLTSELKDFVGPFPFGNTVTPTVNANVNRVVTCINTDATITATDISPTGSTIEWYDPSNVLIPGDNPQDPDRVVTAAGTYTVKVYAPGFSGCFASATVLVVVDKAPPIVTCSGTNVSCNGGNNGSASVSASGGTPPYTYLWSNGSTDASAGNNLTAGKYTVTVTGANGCSATCDYTVTEPAAVTLAASHTNVSCNGAADGKLTIDSFNGTGTPVFSLSTNGGAYVVMTEAAIEAASYGPGTYSIKVAYPDGNNPPGTGVCEKTETEIISQPDAVSLAASHTNVSCSGTADGKLTIDSFSGTGTPTFYLKKDAGAFVQMTEAAIEAASYGPGTYTIKVTYPDGNNPPGTGVCEKTETEIISQPDAVTLDISSTNVTCNGDADGKLSIDSFSGTGTPIFYLKKDAGAFTQMTEAAIEAATYGPGTYTIKVEYPDGNNPPGTGVCNTAQDETIIQPNLVTLSTSHTNVTCFGDANGKLTIDSYNGTGTPIFSLSTNGGAYVVMTEAAIEAASYGPGTYTIKVAYPDGNGNAGVCEKTESETISQPNAVTLATSHTNVTCNGAADGKLTIDSFSGTGTPVFSLSTNGGAYVVMTEAAIEAASYGPGTYTIKVAYPDGNGNVGVCEKTESETISQPDAVTLDISSTNVTCNGDADGKLSIDTYSGTGTPIFYLKKDAGAFVQMTEAAIEAATYGPGTYTVKVEYPDGNNPPGTGVCNTAQDETIIQPSLVTLVASHTNVSCNGAADGKLTIDSFSGTGTPVFSLSTDGGAYVVMTEAAIEAASYGPGTYIIKVAYPDGNGNVGVCEKTETEIISQPDAVTLVTSFTNVSCYGAVDGKLTIDSFSGTGTPVFSLSTNGGAFVVMTEAAIEAGNYAAGTYTIKVAYPDGNNPPGTGVCEKTETEIIPEGPSCGYGCTPGFWQGGKGKTLWDNPNDPIAQAVGFTTNTLLSTVLPGVSGICSIPNNLKMIDAITLGGGNCQKLIRHGVAAILNATTLAEYPLPSGINNVTELKAAIIAAVTNNCGCEALASELAANNELNHDLCGTITTDVINQLNTNALLKTTSSTKTSEEASFTAAPVPFKDQLTVSYDFDYVTDVRIEVINISGVVVAKSYDTNGYLNKSVLLNIPYTGQEEVYVIKLTTNRGSSTQKVLSSR